MDQGLDTRAGDQRLAELLAGDRFDGKHASRARLAPDAVHLGEATDTHAEIGFDLEKLLDGRLLVQGASGAGKSWTLRRILERTHGRIQHIVIDPEGEFCSLADEFGHVVVDAHQLDIAAIALLASRVREHRVSVLFDLSEMDRTRQMTAVAAFLEALIEAPREHWHPALVVMDEAHLFAPFGGQGSEAPSVRKASIGAVSDLMSRGRKRGLCGVLATQRLARLAKSVVSEAFNFLIGLNTLDLDIRRAAETIGWDSRKAFDRLPVLEPGEFVVTGPAFSRSPAVIVVGPVKTLHRGARPPLSAPDAADPARLDLDALVQSSEGDRELKFLPGTKAVRGFIRNPAFGNAGRIWRELVPLAPDGARMADLAQHLKLEFDQVAASLALLDSFGAVEFDGRGKETSVRVAKDMTL
jgi:hypothetical protein